MILSIWTVLYVVIQIAEWKNIHLYVRKKIGFNLVAELWSYEHSMHIQAVLIRSNYNLCAYLLRMYLCTKAYNVTSEQGLHVIWAGRRALQNEVQHRKAGQVHLSTPKCSIYSIKTPSLMLIHTHRQTPAFFVSKQRCVLSIPGLPLCITYTSGKYLPLKPQCEVR